MPAYPVQQSLVSEELDNCTRAVQTILDSGIH